MEGIHGFCDGFIDGMIRRWDDRWDYMNMDFSDDTKMG
jgi:hypothetical protein